ncbi:hypothetical protein GNP82_08270 [Aliivibrio fischeri]|uniref:hypothetical protein n=1 Tax=Aliivibrio fischeri TaxID=668 RepID=UPI0012D9DF13|nr:hypothetical protein [Aliivibrio fischeri]MUK37544.1 hypothetical protein [Aliivibrio fischeri]
MSQDNNQKLWPLTYTLDNTEKVEYNGENLTLAQLYLAVIKELSHTKKHNKYTLGIDDEMVHELWRLPALPRLTADNKITFLMANCIDYSFPVILDILKNVVLLESESSQRKSIVEAIDAKLSWPQKKTTTLKKDDKENNDICSILFKLFNQCIENIKDNNTDTEIWPSATTYSIIDSLRKKKLFYVNTKSNSFDLTINLGSDRSLLTKKILQENPTVEIKESKSKHIMLGSLRDKLIFIDISSAIMEVIETNDTLCKYYYGIPLDLYISINKEGNEEERAVLLKKRKEIRQTVQAIFDYDMLEI